MRIALIVGVAVATTVALASSVAYALARSALDADTDAVLWNRAAIVQRELGRPVAQSQPPFPRRRELAERRLFGAERLDALVQVLDGEGEILTGPFPDDLPVDDVDRAIARGGARDSTREIVIDGQTYRLLTVALPDGAAQIAVDVDGNEALLRNYRNQLIAVVTMGAVVAGLVGWSVAGRAVRPVQRLTEAAEHVATTQDLSDRIELEGDDELARLGSAFNAMLAALADSRDQQRRLIEDASHELRTPLTSLRTNAEVLTRADRLDPADRERLTDDLRAEAAQLAELVDELVQLARETTDDEPVEVLDPLDATHAAAARTARRSGRQIEVVARAPAAVRVRPSQFDRALSNLLTNATLHTPPDSPVEVVIEGASVAVVDHGPGILPSDRDRVFERFWRAPEARSRPGSGLGLAIVAQLIAANGGETFVRDTPGGGATVGFTLPQATGDPGTSG